MTQTICAKDDDSILQMTKQQYTEDEATTMLHLKAEIHRLRAEVTRLKRVQQPQRERRSVSLTSRPARTRNTTEIPTNKGTIELPTNNERHASASGLHHRKHPHEFVGLLKGRNNNNNVKEDCLLQPKDNFTDEDDQLESQQHPHEEEEENENTNSEELSFTSVVMDRAGWLAGLLVLQSLSSFIIQRNEILLQDHAVIVRFLTMLIGAGGNAGNQATVKVIRGLAVGSIRSDSFLDFWREELKVGLAISGILAVAGCLRVAVFAVPWKETLAITFSLFSIVWISTVLGSLLPMGLQLLRIDPAHSSTTIQVIMDILGVVITVSICSALLN